MCVVLALGVMTECTTVAKCGRRDSNSETAAFEAARYANSHHTRDEIGHRSVTADAAPNVRWRVAPGPSSYGSNPPARGVELFITRDPDGSYRTKLVDLP